MAQLNKSIGTSWGKHHVVDVQGAATAAMLTQRIATNSLLSIQIEIEEQDRPDKRTAKRMYSFLAGTLNDAGAPRVTGSSCCWERRYL